MVYLHTTVLTVFTGDVDDIEHFSTRREQCWSSFPLNSLRRRLSRVSFAVEAIFYRGDLAFGVLYINQINPETLHFHEPSSSMGYLPPYEITIHQVLLSI
jgi:hypothetical protein